LFFLLLVSELLLLLLLQLLKRLQRVAASIHCVVEGPVIRHWNRREEKRREEKRREEGEKKERESPLSRQLSFLSFSHNCIYLSTFIINEKKKKKNTSEV